MAVTVAPQQLQALLMRVVAAAVPSLALRWLAQVAAVAVLLVPATPRVPQLVAGRTLEVEVAAVRVARPPQLAALPVARELL
jgi:hypothetical protein